MPDIQGTKINPDRFDKSQIVFYIPLLILSVVMILPLIFVVCQAFKPMDELFLYPPRIFVRNPTFENMANLFNLEGVNTIFDRDDKSIVPISRYFLNSIVITVMIVFSAMFTSSAAGYALSKIRFKFKKLLFEVIMLALMFVPAAVLIPKYLVVQRLGLMDTYWGHVLPMIAMPVMVFLAKQFSDQIPDELLEAARIDGAGEVPAFFRIVIPMLRPAIATVSIIAFQNAWNNVETSSYFMNKEVMRTFAFFMSTLTGKTNIVAGAGITAAAVLIMFVPNLIIFFISQSKVMATMAHSGIK